jgi:hypothetical protein
MLVGKLEVGERPVEEILRPKGAAHGRRLCEALSTRATTRAMLDPPETGL